MTRLIDADALKKENERLLHCDFPYLSEITLEELIDDAPTIDAVPVRRGKWIIRDNPGTGWYRITCSECGEDVTATAPCIGFFPNAKVIWNYCPECGARMDKDE